MRVTISGPAIVIGGVAFARHELDTARRLDAAGRSHHQIAKALGGCGPSHVALLLGVTT